MSKIAGKTRFCPFCRKISLFVLTSTVLYKTIGEKKTLILRRNRNFNFRLVMSSHSNLVTLLSFIRVMSESTNAPASSNTTPNLLPSLSETSPAQTELVKLLSGLLRGTRATVDPAMTQQMASLVQSGKISQRHILQVARIRLFNPDFRLWRSFSSRNLRKHTLKISQTQW